MKIRLIALLLILPIALLACSGPSAPVSLTPSAPTVAPSPTVTATPVARPTSTPAPTATPTVAATPSPETSRLVLWESLPPAQADQLAADVAAFNRIFPHITIELQHYDTPATLVAAVQAGRVDYDLILGAAPLLAQLQQAGKLQPLTALFPPTFWDGFINAALTGAGWNEEIWGVPDEAGFHLLLFYNTDWVASPPATTGAMAKLAQELTGNARQGLVMNSADPLWLIPWLGGYGGWITDDQGQPTLNSPAMIEALTLYQSWQNGAVDYTQAREAFTGGRAAMLIDGNWAIDELPAETAINWQVAPLPALDPGGQSPVPLVLARYWAVGADTTGGRAESAIAFLEFIVTPERQLAWTEQFGLLPSRRDALASPQILTNSTLRISAQQLQAGRGVPLGVDTNALLDAMREPLQQVLAGELQPATAAELMQAQAPSPPLLSTE